MTWGQERRTALIERDAAISVLQRAVRAAAEGEGSLILVEGAAGLGRSSLLDAAAAEAQVAGLLTLRASGGEVEQATTFSIVTDLLRPAVDPNDVEIFRGAAKLARPLFTSEKTEGRPMSRFHGLVWTISNLSEKKPLALIIDDAQWADLTSLGFFNYLTRHLTELPVVVVMAVRLGELHENFDQLVGLRSQGASYGITLDALSERGCLAMLRTLGLQVTDDAGRVCLEMTKGVPSAIAGLAKGISGHEVVDAESLRASLRTTAVGSPGLMWASQTLASEEIDVCRAVAVLGHDATPERIARLLGRDRLQTSEIISTLVLIGLLRIEPSLGFVHPPDRAGCYAELAPEARGEMHRLAARLLLDEEERLPRIAAHLLQTEPSGEPWVADALEEAARDAMTEGAPELAVRYLDRALAESLDPKSKGRLLSQLAIACAAAGNDRYRRHLAQATGLLDSTEEVAEVFYEVGRHLYGKGMLVDACEVLDEALVRVGDQGPLGTRLRTLYLLTARLEPSRRPSVIRELGDLRIDGDVEDSLSGRLLLMEAALASIRNCEPYMRAVQLMLRAMPGPDEFLDEAVLTTLIPQMIPCLTWCDHLKETNALAVRAIADARESGSLLAYANVGSYAALGMYMRGYVKEAEALGRQALDALPFVWSVAVPYAATITAYSSIERGDLDAAEEALRQAEGREWEDVVERPFYLEARGRLRALKGDLPGAIEDLRESGRLMVSLIGTNNPAMLGWRSRLARLQIAAGDSDDSFDLIDEEIYYARAFGAPRALATALRVSGEARNEVEPIEEALSLLDGSLARLERAYCSLALGKVLFAKGSNKEAREALIEALMVGEMAGSVAIQDEARQALRVAGAKPRRPVVTGIAALTPGELRVARFAARGYSNREIAEALFVTVKAVEWHLGNAYRKLGIRSRIQLKEAIGGGASSGAPDESPPAG